jgi:aryl-alcohol dehydrogenase-like predicted oxidoreductase
VFDDLEAATHAYREAQAAVGDAERDLAAVKAEVPLARGRLAEAIVRAARAGVRQVDIVRVTGYNRERVRQICRAAGIEPPGDDA